MYCTSIRLISLFIFINETIGDADVAIKYVEAFHISPGGKL
jgi:hypothetical protein